MVVNAFRRATSVVSTKLRPPRLLPDHVTRGRLHELLDTGIGRKLTLVSAPAGFGKSTLLAGWLRTDARPHAWLSLDEYDDDLAAFLQTLVEALRAVSPEAGQSALSLLPQAADPPLRFLSEMLVDDVAQIDQPFVVVLDDFHLIRNRAVHRLLGAMLKRMPPNLQIVIASRTVPALSISALRGRDELAEVRAHDLRFDLHEAELFLERSASQRLSQVEIQGLHAQAEGWAVLLRLAALEGGGSPGGPGATSTTPSVRRWVDSFLMDEVLDRQSPELRQFLLQISVLDRFCVPLCDAAMGGTGSDAERGLLDQVEQLGLFLVALDDERRWYRFHHLFRDTLRRRLEREIDPTTIREIHLRASAWLAAGGHVEEALQHALAAGDVTGAASIVEQNALSCIERDQWLTLDTWLRRLPADVVHQNPVLAFAQLRVLSFGSRISELAASLTNLDALLAQYPTDAGPRINSLRCGVSATWSFLLSTRGDGDERANAKAAQAVQWLPLSVMQHHPNVESVRGRAVLQYAISEQVLGRGDSVRTWIDDDLRQAGDGHPVYAARLLMARGHVELSSGQFIQLAHTARQLMHIATEHHLPNDRAWGCLFAAHVAYEWNDLAAARQHCIDGLTHRDNAYAGCVLSLTLRLALTFLATGRLDDARRLALDALELAEKTNRLAGVGSLRSFEARLALASGDLDAAAHWMQAVPRDSRLTLSYYAEEPHVTRVRVLLATHSEASLAAAATVANDALAVAEARHALPRIVEILALRALVEQAQGDSEAALRTLSRAVTLGETGRFTRTFLDLGAPMAGLLTRLARFDGDPLVRAATRRLMTAALGDTAPAQTAVPSRALVLPDDVEPLTWREREVLHLLDARYANKEIGKMLGISPETVKKHVANIYGKLQVRGRVEAVTRAHQLGLLQEATTLATRR